MPIVGARQCKYRRSRRQQLIETVREHSMAFRDRRIATCCDEHWQHLWNEINLYVGPNDGGVQQVLSNNLVGLLYVRNYGNDRELQQLRQLRDHLSTLGKRVDIFAVTTEPNHEIKTWDG